VPQALDVLDLGPAKLLEIGLERRLPLVPRLWLTEERRAQLEDEWRAVLVELLAGGRAAKEALAPRRLRVGVRARDVRLGFGALPPRGIGDQHLEDARKYAVWLAVRRPAKMGEPTRMQRHTGKVPDFGDKNGMIPFVFGTKCVRLKDEQERLGWKGAGNRVADGIFVGIDHDHRQRHGRYRARVAEGRLSRR
jgi:hypothetical protein